MIFESILRDSKSAAIKWVEEIGRQIDTLENFPLRCHIIPEAQELGEKYRYLIYGSYRTIFRVEGSNVIIMRFIHSDRLLDLQIFEK
jgi:plasmid stabilization system protein ParE